MSDWTDKKAMGLEELVYHARLQVGGSTVSYRPPEGEEVEGFEVGHSIMFSAGEGTAPVHLSRPTLVWMVLNAITPGQYEQLLDEVGGA